MSDATRPRYRCAFNASADALATLREAEPFIGGVVEVGSGQLALEADPVAARLYREARASLAALCDRLLVTEMPPRRKAG